MNLHNIDLEKSVLSSLMAFDDVIAEMGVELQSDDFFAGRHQVIFDAIQALHNERSSYDVVMVKDYLESRGQLEIAGGEGYLGDILTNSPATKFNLQSYLEKLKDLAQRRKLEQICKLGIDSLSDFSKPISDVVNITVSSLSDSGQAKGEYFFTGELYEAFLDTLEAKAKGSLEPYIDTGFAELDNKLNLNRGDLCVIAGRPSMGKSTLAQNMMTFITQTTGKIGVFFSLEMPKNLVMERLTSAVGEINLTRIKTGQLTEQEKHSLYPALSFLKNLPLIVDDNSNATIGDIRAKLNKIKHQHGEIGVVVVDYLGLMGGISKDPVNEIGEITKGMKAIAKDFDCPVLLLSQLNRSVEKNPDKRPRLSDLRDSGKIEQDADQVIGLYRDEYYNKDSDQRGVAEAIILKNRNGITGTVNLGFQGEYSRFTQLTVNDIPEKFLENRYA